LSTGSLDLPLLSLKPVQVAFKSRAIAISSGRLLSSCEGDRPTDGLARGVGPTQYPRAKSGHPDSNGSYANGLPQTKRLNPLAQARELLLRSDQVPAVEASELGRCARAPGAPCRGPGDAQGRRQS
jgi:hypothetical protein